MDENNIKKYAQIMQDFSLSALEITKFGRKVRLERNMGETVAVRQANPSCTPAQHVVNDVAVSEIQAAGTQAPVAQAPEDPSIFTLASPMIGAFFTSPAENQEPFVNVGDKVKPGDVLCIIESMKLMNEICSDVDGTVVEICAANHQAVDFGHPLFRIKKEA